MSLKAQQMLMTMADYEISAMYRQVFGGYNGDIVLEHLKAGAHFYKPTFDEQSVNPNEDKISIFNEGKRATVMSIETIMGIMPPQPTVPIVEERDKYDQ